VKRPIISTSRITARVARRIAQISPNPNFAPCVGYFGYPF
jgi:hypothetical protein